MRLIDADKLKKHIRRCDDSATRATFDYVDEDDIDDMPTVDVLDKIRDEIEESITDYILGEEDTYMAKRMGDVMTKVFEIIDKYTKGDHE